jgi:hypothetical protein
MRKLKPPSRIIRTTLDKIDEGLFPDGVYILAYMGRVTYVGKTNMSVGQRLLSHWYSALARKATLGAWLRKIQGDWSNVRLDILVPPDDEDERWRKEVEYACIRKFRPLFNGHYNTGA